MHSFSLFVAGTTAVVPGLPRLPIILKLFFLLLLLILLPISLVLMSKKLGVFPPRATTDFDNTHTKFPILDVSLFALLLAAFFFY